MSPEFTPWASLAGGIMIGVASSLLMLVAGRVMGVTGILTGLVQPASAREFSWRAVLVLGMISGPLAAAAITGRMPVIDVPVSLPMLLIGGVMVGVGVTYGSGCTSGHGVCGLARVSPRSAVATLSFMLAAIATVYVIRHLIGA